MPKDGAEKAVIDALEPLAATHGVDIVDVEVVGATKNPTVRVRIDHADETVDTISLDEVSEQTGWISEAIDELDPFPGSFMLEVSSPGLDRPLRRAHDFERFAGEQVSLVTTATEGRRRFSGKLVGIDAEGVVNIETDEGELLIPLDQIAKCVIKPDFDLPGKPGKGNH